MSDNKTERRPSLRIIEFIGDGNAVLRFTDDTERLVPAGDVAVCGAADAKDALASLYQKTNGTMRTCRHYPDSVCTMRRCVRRGCQRAADVLRGEPSGE